MRINYLKSENYTFYGTKKRRIQAIVIHYTGMRTLQSAVERLLYSKYKVSSHYVISRNGKILQLVKDNNIAWHAGISNWFNFKNLNNNIELNALTNVVAYNVGIGDFDGEIQFEYSEKFYNFRKIIIKNGSRYTSLRVRSVSRSFVPFLCTKNTRTDVFNN